jgi:peptide/nickel transport system ATP-binding protein
MILTLLSSITHDLRAAAQICDTIVVMQNGCMVESGLTEKMLTAPQQEYTRALIEAAPGRDWDFRNFRPLHANRTVIVAC